ncbi:alpha-2-macroglobulin [Flammeovirga sp. EKP202]|uniref:alpha-2-macroglobulin family protein n=1 Tax=Flammeovirga sp. EKP202 TaxID=2770592 RepID=UPI00165FCBA6|nr:alpha-2-macroglobulin [Flammeovirga sp. EKP202]MBD0403382.1 alpha-2-macroglobulin family protein [Flammeovirga sp. EKP202]
MKQKLRACLLLLLFFNLLIGCDTTTSDDEETKVIYNNFDGEISTFQNLSVTLSKEIRESKNDEWLNEQYFTISPEVKGKFKWTAKNTVIFSPENGFSPSTDYTLKLSESVFAKEGIVLDKSQLNYSFHTPYLKANYASIAWALGKNNQAEPHLTLNFNYSVDREKVAQKIIIKDGDRVLKSELVSKGKGTQVVLAIKGEVPEKEVAVNIIIQKGIMLKRAKVASKEQKLKSIIPKKEKFEISSVVAKILSDQNVIEIKANQGFYNEKLKSKISVSPKVAFEVETIESGVQLVGDFRAGQSYTVSISSEVKGVFRTKLGTRYKKKVVFGEVEPSISFADKKSIYMSNKSSKKIDLNIISVPEVDINIYKIYKNNLYAFFNDNSNYQESDYYYYGPQYYKLGDEVFSQKNVAVNDLPTSGNFQTFSLDFLDENRFNGVYVVEIRSSKKRYLAARKLISISDIGLLVKQGKNSVLVYANSIADASPIENTKITLVSRNNQELISVNTNAKGVAEFKDIESATKGFNVRMIYAEKGNDFNYLNYDQTRVATERFDVGGMRLNSTGLMTYIYGDRNLYRPGETIYYKTITRDKDWNPITDQPIKIKVYLPDGNLLKSERGTLNEEGSYESKVKLMDGGVTGYYTIEVSTANDIILSSKRISVEDFMPDRIKVTTKTDKEQVGVESKFEINATAMNLFGTPASDRSYEIDFSLNRKNIYVKELSEYNFNLKGNISLRYEDHLRQSKTDAAGNFSETFLIEDIYKNSGILEGKLYTTVFDESGRPVRRLNTIEIPTQDYFLGVKDQDWYIKTRQQTRLPLVAVDKNRKIKSGVKAEVELVRYEWQSVMESTYNGRYRYVSRKKEIALEKTSITINGKNTTYDFLPEASGQYEVRIRLPKAKTYISKRYYAYGWGMTSSSAFQVDKEGRVTIEAENPTYQVGDKAKLLFKTPFKGKLLVTVEQDDVLSHYELDTDEQSASLELPIQEEYLPNVFVTATLIKGAKDNALPLTVAHGFTSIKVESVKSKLALKINAPKESRSNRTQEIEVVAESGEKNIEMTIAVVDEGILQIKNYKTPNPFNYFYQNRALGVNTYDVYPLVMQFKQQANSFGSDMANLGARANPMVNNRVNLVAFWSGTLKTDSDGKASFKVDIPEFSGELRIMAVANKQKAFGSAEARMKVKDPLVLSASLPRFLSPSDVNDASVMMTNTTNKEVRVNTKVNVSGALTVDQSQLETVTIPANSEKRVSFKLTAAQEIGEGKVVVIANANGEDFITKTNLNVRPVTSLLKSTASGVVKTGNNKTVDLKKDYISSSVNGKLWLSKSPMLEFAEDLNYLVRYPYGCVEQTVSAVFPQLYLADLASKMTKDVSEGSVDYNINEAIRKLQSMQIYNGALTYWQGGSYESFWGSAYAAHFLMEAQKNGYQVNQKTLDKLLDYLSKKVKKKSTRNYYYYSNGTRIIEKAASKTVFYSLYILAEAGRADIATMNYYKQNQKLIPRNSKYILATTYLRAGDQKTYRLLLPNKLNSDKAEKEFGGSFSSYIRDQALVLNALLGTDPKNAQVGTIARHLTESMKSESWMSTQERAFSLLALGKLAKKANSQEVKASITADGKKLASFNNEDLTLTKEVLGKQINIAASGNGELYYFAELEGLNASGVYPEEDKGLKVRRTYYNREGQVINSDQFKQNELIIVGISLHSDGKDIENVVVTDMLPAGFEIENPRLGAVPGVKWTRDKASTPQHVDFRDDRVNFFVTATTKSRTYYYVVRAVSKGTFKVGPVSADAMYNGEYRSYHGAKSIVVE